MRKSNTCILAIAAVAVASVVSTGAIAQSHRTVAARATSGPAMSQQVRAAHAEDTTPSSTSMAADYANAYRFNGGLSGPICRPGGQVRLADGMHVCQ